MFAPVVYGQKVKIHCYFLPSAGNPVPLEAGSWFNWAPLSMAEVPSGAPLPNAAGTMSPAWRAIVTAPAPGAVCEVLQGTLSRPWYLWENPFAASRLPEVCWDGSDAGCACWDSVGPWARERGWRCCWAGKALGRVGLLLLQRGESWLWPWVGSPASVAALGCSLLVALGPLGQNTPPALPRPPLTASPSATSIPLLIPPGTGTHSSCNHHFLSVVIEFWFYCGKTCCPLIYCNSKDSKAAQTLITASSACLPGEIWMNLILLFCNIGIKVKCVYFSPDVFTMLSWSFRN